MEKMNSEEKKEIRELKLKITLMQIAVFSVKAFNVIKRIVIFIFTLAFQVIKLIFLAMYYALLIAVKICVGLFASNNTSSAKRYTKPRKRTRREYEEDDDELTIDEMMIIDEIWDDF